MAVRKEKLGVLAYESMGDEAVFCRPDHVPKRLRATMVAQR